MYHVQQFQFQFQGMLATIMVISGDITELVDAFAAASFVFYLLVFVGLIIMRFTHSKEPRIFKVTSDCMCCIQSII